jgi:hypothetical protein
LSLSPPLRWLCSLHITYNSHALFFLYLLRFSVRSGERTAQQTSKREREEEMSKRPTHRSTSWLIFR